MSFQDGARGKASLGPGLPGSARWQRSQPFSVASAFIASGDGCAANAGSPHKSAAAIKIEIKRATMRPGITCELQQAKQQKISLSRSSQA